MQDCFGAEEMNLEKRPHKPLLPTVSPRPRQTDESAVGLERRAHGSGEPRRGIAGGGPHRGAADARAQPLEGPRVPRRTGGRRGLLEARALHREPAPRADPGDPARAGGAARVGVRAPFVDTVDKMQGQESLAVLVSYGVSDPETAAQEAAFIYSLPRLNVSASRARAKCVVFLPRALLGAVLRRDDQPRRGGGARAHARAARLRRASGTSKVFALDGVEGGAGATMTVFRRGQA